MKKVLAFFLAMIVAYTPALVFAGAAEKWDRLSLVYDRAGNIINVEHRKMILEAANDAVYKAKVPVSASAVGTTAASMVRFGLHGAAIAGVIYGMGWVIDEFGKVVKIPEKHSDPRHPSNAYFWVVGSSPNHPDLVRTEVDTSVCSGLSRNSGQPVMSYSTTTAKINTSNGTLNCHAYTDGGWELIVLTADRHVNPDYNPNSVPDAPKPIPISDSELGNAIIDSPSAPQILPDIYSPKNPIREQHPSAPAPAPVAVEDALDAANPTPSPDNPPKGSISPKPAEDTDGDGIPDTVPDGNDFELPAFCSWAMAACNFFGVQKTDNKTTHRKQDEQIANQEKQLQQDKNFFQKVEDFFSWSKDDSLIDDSESVEIQEPKEFDNSIFSTNRFSVSRQCPVPEVHTINITGQTVSFSFDLAPLCSVAELARPALVACSYLYAAYIVIGAARNG